MVMSCRLRVVEQKFGDVDMGPSSCVTPFHADCVSGKATHASSIPNGKPLGSCQNCRNQLMT